ncbi:MAG: carboxypeptidase M32 [Limnohabitans sp.]|nr:carboxypeptidase M32 [Limnohabitans sp.]
MSQNKTSPYEQLVARWKQMHHFSHLQSIASWDQATMMPPQSNEARAQAMAELGTHLHALLTADDVSAWLKEAETLQLAPEQTGNLREMKRQWTAEKVLPAALVRDKQLATSRCEHAWRSLRTQNDWKGFVPLLKEVVNLTRQEARHLANMHGVTPYEAMLDRYEPGLSTQDIDQTLGQLASWLPDLIRTSVKQQASQTVLLPQGPFPVERQKQLCLQIMGALGFNFSAGRLDVSTHPFCGGVPEDVRITTRFNTDEFLTSLYGTIHETGHALYEQNLPRDWLGQPAAQARSMAIHESQSLFFEMQLGANAGFIEWLSPQLTATFGEQAALAPDNLRRLLTRVKPGLIRVDADEVTYPAHILIRYGIEKSLIEGEIEVEDIPGLWNEGMHHWLGQDTQGNFKDGPMQDIHWSLGAFGYFPCYTLGAMYAAQWFACMQDQQIGHAADLRKGDFTAIKSWLNSNVWSQASFWPTRELVTRASSQPLNPAFYQKHLQNRYL